jgi:hypothetical protein
MNRAAELVGKDEVLVDVGVTGEVPLKQTGLAMSEENLLS